MRIATWNVERLKHRKSLGLILRACSQAEADILVLTETDQAVRPDYLYSFHSPAVSEIDPHLYKATENRVSIFTNYRCIRQHPTYDPYTALCVELETGIGNLLVYGTIIGAYGNRHPDFKADILGQTADFARLSGMADGLCICGDMNCSFADNYYYTEYGRDALLRSFRENDILLMTGNVKECIDHIAVSRRYIGRNIGRAEEWNQGRELSDHKGIAITIE